jgi:hypothetical protein
MEFDKDNSSVDIDLDAQSNQKLAATIVEIAGLLLKRSEILLAPGNIVADETVPEVDTAPEATTLIDKESFKAEKLKWAVLGGNVTVSDINEGRELEDRVKELDPEVVAKEYDAFFDETVAAYLNERRRVNPNVEFILSATPNVLVTGEEVIELQKKIGVRQGIATDVWSDVLNMHTAQALTGADPSNGNTAIFSIRENTPTEGMSGNTTAQIKELEKKQEVNPLIRDHTPLEAVTHANTLQAEHGVLKGDAAFRATVARNFTMKPKLLGVNRYVPRFCVDVGGGPRSSDSGVDYGGGVALVVGQKLKF